MIAYVAFWVCLACAVGAILQYLTELSIKLAMIHGRTCDVRWNFTGMGLNVMLWVGLTAFLWHYNFG